MKRIIESGRERSETKSEFAGDDSILNVKVSFSLDETSYFVVTLGFPVAHLFSGKFFLILKPSYVPSYSVSQLW